MAVPSWLLKWRSPNWGPAGLDSQTEEISTWLTGAQAHFGCKKFDKSLRCTDDPGERSRAGGKSHFRIAGRRSWRPSGKVAGELSRV
ncbi:unnamed protein product [Gadus morhua 'NCC']